MSFSLLVGLTGGIAAGKSTVARELAVRGARIVDGDAAARHVVDPETPAGAAVIDRIVEMLGPGVRTATGGLDRTAVAERIFTDTALLHQYNALLRPAILGEVSSRIVQARLTPGVIVHEIPLLSRNTPPLPWTYDLVVTVEASLTERRRRLVELRGHTPEDADRRILAQGDEADRVAVADIVLRTDIDLAHTRSEVDALWSRLSAKRRPR